MWEGQRCLYRSMWNYKGRIKTMRFNSVVFRNKCVSFLLNAVVKHHLDSVTKSYVVQELHEFVC